MSAQLLYADIAVIVNKDNNVSEIAAKDLRMIYLGKRSTFDNGLNAQPLDQLEGSELQKLFAKSVLRKTPSSLNSYWSRQMFSGKGTPPNQINGGDSAIIDNVSSNKNAVAYINSDNVTDDVKVILTIAR